MVAVRFAVGTPAILKVSMTSQVSQSNTEKVPQLGRNNFRTFHHSHKIKPSTTQCLIICIRFVFCPTIFPTQLRVFQMSIFPVQFLYVIALTVKLSYILPQQQRQQAAYNILCSIAQQRHALHPQGYNSFFLKTEFSSVCNDRQPIKLTGRTSLFCFRKQTEQQHFYICLSVCHYKRKYLLTTNFDIQNKVKSSVKNLCQGLGMFYNTTATSTTIHELSNHLKEHKIAAYKYYLQRL